MTAARRLTGQAFGAAVVNVLLAAVGIVSTPFLLHGLGASSYGLFTLLSVAAGHLANLEFGFGFATVRHVSRARGAGDTRAESEVLETSLGVFAASSILSGLVLALGASFLARRFFHVAPEHVDTATHVFRAGAIIVSGTFLTQFYAGVLQAYGRFDWLNGARLFFGAASAAVAMGVVALGGDVARVVDAQACLSIAYCLTLGTVLRRLRGRETLPWIHSATLREMAAFGFWVFVAGIAYQWIVNGPPLILGTLAATAELPKFSVPFGIVQRLSVLMQSASMAFYPFVSAASASSDQGLLERVFRSHLRMTVLTLGPVVAFLAVFGEPLLGAWIGDEFSRGAGPALRWLAIGTLVQSFSTAPADLARGLGRPEWVFAYTVFTAILGIAGSFLFVPHWQATGAALGYLLGVGVIGLPFLLLTARHFLGLTAGALLETLALPALAVGVTAGAFAIALRAYSSLPVLLFEIGIVTAGYLAVTYSWILEPRERNAIVGIVRHPRLASV